MSDWTSGYVADLGYTHGCYPEFSLERLRMAFLSAGLVLPAITTACELGYGQGLSANVCAAATDVQWHGTDFLPAQAAHAQELAAAAGRGARFLDEAFADYCARTDLPDFDFIGLHGTWSWVNEDNRRILVDFIRRKLKVGGVLYISYNTQPGWANMMPMRHLLVEHARVMGATGQGSAGRIGGAMQFGEQLMALDPLYASRNPEVKGRFANLKGKDRAYLAHEFFNRDWHPMPFAHVAEALEPAKVEFACSAALTDHLDEIHLTAAQQAFLRNVPHTGLRQTARDFLLDTQFRRDYWVRGLRRMGVQEQLDAWRALRVLLVTPGADIALRTKGTLGEVALQPELYAPVIAALADHGIRSIADLEQQLAPHGLVLPRILQAVRMLHAKGDLALVQDEPARAAAAAPCGRLNAHLMRRSRSLEEAQALASPVTGAAVPVSRFQQLFLLAREQCRREPADWAAFVAEILQANREQVLRDGRPLASPADLQAELLRQASEFARQRLPALVALQVAPPDPAG
ncbi:methyltransferase regulatory domain-containing protein [Ramlibacter sp.]|uniref:methyltransferase regulatory domain-containing protein n=1 Tax=Ramlibacter sp. TaxID=1917967 RepID=UPI0035AEF53D